MLNALLVLLATSVAAPTCDGVDSVSESVQVAWISPVRQRVSSDRYMEVVRLADLRAWVKKNGDDQARLLQALGLVGKRAGWRSEMDWKVTIFDVRADWICRPIRGMNPGDMVIICSYAQFLEAELPHTPIVVKVDGNNKPRTSTGNSSP